MNATLKVVIVDDNLTFLEGLEALLDMDDRIEVVARFTNGRDLVEYDRLNQVDLILLDVEMPEMNGIIAAKLVNFENPRVKIIAVTMYQDKVYLSQLIESGFSGFVNKTNVSNELFDTISRILEGELCFPESIS